MLFALPDLCPDTVRQELVSVGLPAVCVQSAWEEFKASVARLWHEAQVEQAQISKDNFNAAHRPIDGIGQNTFRISRKMEQVISLLSTVDAIKAKDFRKRLIRDNPQFCFVPKVEQKPVLIKPSGFGPNTIQPKPAVKTLIVPRDTPTPP